MLRGGRGSGHLDELIAHRHRNSVQDDTHDDGNSFAVLRHQSLLCHPLHLGASYSHEGLRAARAVHHAWLVVGLDGFVHRRGGTFGDVVRLAVSDGLRKLPEARRHQRDERGPHLAHLEGHAVGPHLAHPAPHPPHRTAADVGAVHRGNVALAHVGHGLVDLDDVRCWPRRLAGSARLLSGEFPGLVSGAERGSAGVLDLTGYCDVHALPELHRRRELA
mmetsp:Transcript_956/g.3838  ORF Transcript_956/g.3838 Transcript_956/m.3838 type:complete len:219 (+) Transcript_956:255-911(+)